MMRREMAEVVCSIEFAGEEDDPENHDDQAAAAAVVVVSRVLEFYSGIGGMRYSLMKAGIQAKLVEAFDINDKANDVYEYNFGDRPCQGNIQTLTAADLDKYKADAWLMSPPCQPYTRQGLRRDINDPRSCSFLDLLELLPLNRQFPLMLFVENVVGFEVSEAHELMIKAFQEAGFCTQEYILSPLQFGIPYSRPRYFCLAKRKPLLFARPDLNAQLLHTNDHLCEEIRAPTKVIREFLEIKPNRTLALPQEDVISSVSNSQESINQDNHFPRYTVPRDLIERWGSAMDVVFPESKRCCCFTKSYYRYVKGTGSLLATTEEQDFQTGDDISSSLNQLGLRYFTPREVANMHSFPVEFDFPDHISLRQRYAMLGNSLIVAVVAPLLRYLFTEPS